VLGAAGLLNGYNATSHRLARDLLPLFGATPVNARVVADRNRITIGEDRVEAMKARKRLGLG